MSFDWAKALCMCNFRPFEDIRAFAASMGVSSGEEWGALVKRGHLPLDIPRTPWVVYRREWRGWRHFLGVGRVDNFLKRFASFDEAKTFATSSGIKSGPEWFLKFRSGSLPLGLPGNPQMYYRKEFTSWGDFLGTGNKCLRSFEYRPFEQARAYARSLKLHGRKDWEIMFSNKSLPNDLPRSPEQVYSDKGWAGCGDFFGTGNTRSKQFLSFKEARKVVRSLKIKTGSQYRSAFSAGGFPDGLPSQPKMSYANKGWNGWGDFTGTGNVRCKNFRSFEQAREYARSMNLDDHFSWSKLAKSGKLPPDLPWAPGHAYAGKGWNGWKDFRLPRKDGQKGKRSRISKMCTFRKARAYARSLGIKRVSEWEALATSGSLPKDIPHAPDQTYASEWDCWADFLGSGWRFRKNVPCREFSAARAFAHSLGLKSWSQWLKFARSSRKPHDIPIQPNKRYLGKGWVSHSDWIGKVTINPLPASKE